MKKLTPKQKQFCKEYIIDLNATQAATRAGYSSKAAKITGHRLLTNVNVQKQIQKAMNRRSARTEITADNILRELAKIGFSNILDYVQFDGETVVFKDSDGLDREKAACISEVSADIVSVTVDDKAYKETRKLKFKLYDKVKSLELLGKHLKLFTEKIDLGGQEDNPLGIEISDEQILKILEACKST